MKRLLCSLLILAAASGTAADANRLTHLADSTPYWPGSASPKFITPQWIGEPGIDAAVILAIDDMRDPVKYEAFLRPILDRLKRITPEHGGDGSSPLSIMTNTISAADPQIAAWLKEGVTIESHTLTHPCPCLGKATFEEAVRTYHDSVDLLSSISGNRPVAFRMPCCDSMNSASPRFFSEIFSRNSPQGRFLTIDTSVFTLPPGERFSKYFPTELRPPMKKHLADYAGWIADYPYPYMIGQSALEFPCIVPSDWEALNLLGAKSPNMLDDWKAGLDYVVKKQGVFTAVFHPHGWSSPEQWIEFIDYAEKTYGKRVKFLNFREALERMEKNALAGWPVRSRFGADNGVRLLDLNDDSFMDVVIGAAGKPLTRVWHPATQRWVECATPAKFVSFGDDGATPLRAAFGILRATGEVSLLAPGQADGAWTFRDNAWQAEPALAKGLPPAAHFVLRDFDRDGISELVFGTSVLTWVEKEGSWRQADYSLPPGCALTDARGGDNGLRFADLNADGYDDVIQSNDSGYVVALWARVVKANLGWKRGWPHLVAEGPLATDPAKAKVLPFVLEGRNYGAWFHKDRVVWQNEALATPGTESVSRTFKEIIAFDIPKQKTAEESLKALRPKPGFTVELVAAEPLVEAPVAFDWDAQGRLWVVEMRDYPLGLDGKGKPGGRVKVLTDSDGDGRYDVAATFLEDLLYPTGVMPWRNGVFITASPNILFAADTDGDGRADETRVLFTGFREGNQQHRVNGFAWGLDGWIYGANGDSGGEVTALLPGAAKGKPVPISGRDFRFRPDTLEFEAESGQTQYGRHRDDWGHWFGNNNSTWLWHYTIDDRYLRRNPRLAVKTTKQVLANYPRSTRVFPVSDLPIRFNQPQSLGHLTSGCSAIPYRDDLFGADYASSVFICEPVHNVVHRELLAADGATFTSRRADDEQDREFLASTDPWFRPVMAKTGPDGALYVADFYRFALEHPEWIAPETQSRLDLRAGADKGRIYRVVPTGATPRPIPTIAKLDNAGLVAALESPNGWQRDTAHRLLVERKAAGAAPALRQLAAASQNPKVRAQALAALETLGALDAATLRTALADSQAPVRIQALRVSEGKDAALLPAILALANDKEFTVRHQLALTLGAFRDKRAIAALAKLAEREGDQPQMRLAILSSLQPEDPLFAKLNKPTAAPAVANVVLPKPSTADRAKVIAAYSSVASLKGAPEHGRELYQQACSICHRLKGEGREVGPDLAMVFDKPVDWLVTAIFDPNAAIEDRYRAHTLKLKSGLELSGLISAETANNVVLTLPGGVEMPVLRSDIAAQQRSSRSLMPDGLETVLKPQDVADLIAWFRAK